MATYYQVPNDRLFIKFQFMIGFFGRFDCSLVTTYSFTEAGFHCTDADRKAGIYLKFGIVIDTGNVLGLIRRFYSVEDLQCGDIVGSLQLKTRI